MSFSAPLISFPLTMLIACGLDTDRASGLFLGREIGEIPMLNVLATLVPMCFFAVATDAPNPQAIYIHEQAHCWGWTHPVHSGKRGTGYQAFMPPARYRKPYPASRLVVQFDTMERIKRICGSNEQFGCQWF